jgi:hypothetical protein
VKCPVKDCEKSTTTILALCSHMEEQHEFKSEHVEKTFESEAEYKVRVKTLLGEDNEFSFCACSCGTRSKQRRETWHSPLDTAKSLSSTAIGPENART